MINKEQVQKDTITTPTKHVKSEESGNENWNIIYNKCTKRRSEDYMNVKNSQIQNTNETILTANCFTPLITHSQMIINEDVTKPARKNVTHATNSGWDRVVKNPELVCSTTINLQERFNVNNKVKPNLKTHSETLQHSCIKKEEKYPVPTLINGHITSKESSMNIKQTSTQQQRIKQKTTKTLVSSKCKRHKVLIIGDIHVRNLSEKIRNKLNITYNVTGITKPRANAESITSPSHLAAENLTKNYLLIFYGGTRVVSRN